MAFTGIAVVQQITDRKVRITGLSLAGDAAGTIGLFGDATAGVQLPNAFNPKVYDYQGEDISLAAALQVSYVPVTDVSAAVPISITKGGAPFQISMHNDNAGGGQVSAELEIYVEWQ
jgi:hypothetical protein